MSLVISNRSYRYLFSAAAISNLGDGVSALAFPWLASLLTRDPFLIGMVTFANRLPWFLLTLPIGVITDHYDRRGLMINADIVRLCLTCGVLGIILTLPEAHNSNEMTSIGFLALLAFGLGSAEVVRDNAAQTVLPSIVMRKDLERANGQMWSVEQITGSFVGPPLAGALIAYSLPAPFAFDAVTFGLAAFFVWHISLPPKAPSVRLPMGQSIKEAWVWTKQHPTVLRLALMLGTLNFQSTIFVTLMVLYAQDIFTLSATAYGVLLTAGAVGGVAGGVFGPKVVEHLGPQRSAILGLALFPLECLITAFASSPFIVGGALCIGMFGAVLWNLVTVSYRQRVIPDHLLGRVNSIYRFFGWGFMPLGALAGGWLVNMAEPELGREYAQRVPYFLCFCTGSVLMVYGAIKLRFHHIDNERQADFALKSKPHKRIEP